VFKAVTAESESRRTHNSTTAYYSPWGPKLSNCPTYHGDKVVHQNSTIITPFLV